MNPHARFDVFLSHRREDKPAVERLAQRLREAGLHPFLDRWHLIPGDPWQEGLEQALRNSRTCAVFLGLGGLGPWEAEEMRAALEMRVNTLGFRVIPVFLPGTERPRQGLPLFLSRLHWVDFREGLEDERALRELISGIQGVPPGPSNSSLEILEVCPYRGLEAFREQDAQFFCGRDGITRRLIEALRASRFLSVLGSSGSGKSSLVQAGLLPELRNGALPGSHTWNYHVLSPGARPLEELAVGLGSGDLRAFLDLQQEMARNPQALHSAIRLALQGEDASSRIFILVDQLEELFTLCHSEADRQSFLDNLLYASNAPGDRTVVVVTLRADFYAKAASYKELADRLAENQVVVTPMSREELLQAIETPAHRADLTFDDGLVETILEDLAEQPGSLPLLEHALLELWQHRQGRRLTRAAYAEIQGVKGAIARRAEETYGAMPEPQQLLARRILLRLVQPGEGTEDTRRRALLSELTGDPADAREIEDVVAQLVGSRLLTISRSETTEEEWLDVAHEALIRGWPRLRAWIEEDRESLRLQRRLGERAEEWARINRDEGSLLRGLQLAQLEEWASEHGPEMSPLEREFLTKSVTVRDREAQEKEKQRRIELEGAQARERDQRQLTRLWIGFSAFALIAIVFTHISLVSQERQGRAALARQLAAQVESSLERWPQRSMLLAVEAIEATRRKDNFHLPAAEEALRHALAETEIATPLITDPLELFEAVAFSPDGHWLAVGRSKSVHLWNRLQPLEQPQLPTSDMSVEGLAFSRDGRRLAAWDSRGSARIWRQDQSYPTPEFARKGRETAVGSVEVAVSPDARRLAFGSLSGILEVWDTTVAGERNQRLLGPTGRIISLAFSPDGDKLAVSSEDRSVRLWRLTLKGAELSWEYSHRDPIGKIAFTPDGERLAIEISGEVRLKKVTGEDSGVALPFERSEVFESFQFSPDGSRLAAGSYDGSLYVWSIPSSTRIEPSLTLSQPSQIGPIHTLVFSPDSRKLAVGSWENLVQIWDLENPRKEPLVLRGHEQAVVGAAFSPDGRQLASASWDRSVRLWDLAEAATKLPVTPTKNDFVKVLAFTPDGSRLIAGTWGKAVHLWPVPHLGQQPSVRQKHNTPVMALALAPGGHRFVTSGFDGKARFWRTDGSHEGDLEVAGEGLQGPVINAVAYSPDGFWLATASGDHTIRLWRADRSQTKPFQILRQHSASVYQLAFSSDGRWLASAAGDGTVLLWDTKNWRSEPRVVHKQDSSIPDFAFSPDGSWLATAGHEATLWSLKNISKKPRIIFKGNSSAGPLTFSPDGKWLALASFKNVYLWEVWSIGIPIFGPRVLRGHDDWIGTLKFSPDSRWLATGSSDFTARLWNLENISTGSVALGPGKGAVNVLDFSPDGRWLATVNGSEAPRLWPLRLNELIDTACARAGRNLTRPEWDQVVGDSPYHRTCPRWR